MKRDEEASLRAAHHGPLFSGNGARLIRRDASGGYARITVELDSAGPSPQPGQFVLLRLREGPALPRAFSVLSAATDSVEILIKLDGVLREALGRAPVGTALDLRGPYGRPYVEAISAGRRYVLVGGGSGVAPLLHFAETYPERTAGVAFGVRRAGIRALLPGVDFVVEEESSETADQLLRRRWTPGLGIIACGPEAMLRGIVRDFGGEPETFVSLETRIGCGFGGCQGCSIPTTSGMRRVCREGPLFACSEVPWLI